MLKIDLPGNIRQTKDQEKKFPIKGFQVMIQDNMK